MNKKLPPSRKKLLLRVADAIEQNPQHFDMSSYVAHPEANPDPDENGHCGTTACIAGWAVFLSRPGRKNFEKFARMPYSTVQKRASELLGYNGGRYGFGTVWEYLVYASSWIPCEATARYRFAETAEEKAKAAADYIRYFVSIVGKQEKVDEQAQTRRA